jgi:hypothetical protein
MFSRPSIIVYQGYNRATANGHYTHAIYQAPPDDEQVKLEKCRGH